MHSITVNVLVRSRRSMRGAGALTWLRRDPAPTCMPQNRQHDHHRQGAEQTNGNMRGAPAKRLYSPIDHRRPDRAADIIAAGGDGDGDAAPALEPVRGLGHQRPECRRRAGPDGEMHQNELPHAGRTTRADIAERHQANAHPDRGDDAKTVGQFSGHDAAETETNHPKGEGQRGRAPGRGKFALHHRQRHHHRPHADAADRSDQEGKRKPHPRLTGVRDEAGRILG